MHYSIVGFAPLIVKNPIEIVDSILDPPFKYEILWKNHNMMLLRVNKLIYMERKNIKIYVACFF